LLYDNSEGYDLDLSAEGIGSRSLKNNFIGVFKNVHIPNGETSNIINKPGPYLATILTGNHLIPHSGSVVVDGGIVAPPYTDGNTLRINIGAYEDSETLSIKDVNVKVGVKVYPNPTSSALNIVSKDKSIKNLELLNILGHINRKVEVNGLSANLDMSRLKSGIYFLRIVYGNDEVGEISRIVKN